MRPRPRHLAGAFVVALAGRALHVEAQRRPSDAAPAEGTTGRAGPLRFEAPERIFVPAGEFVMGSDATDVMRAVSLCRRERARFADVARGAADADAVERTLLSVCDDADPGVPSCDPRWFAREGAAHAVWLAAFRVGRTEVTVRDYARCVGAGACREAAIPAGSQSLGGLTRPVVGVSWDDAARFCAWSGGRLPTEAEWERAARGRDARPFPWGWQWDPSRANHGALQASCADGDDGYELSAPVGTYPEGASPDGALDMAGNVMEWVADHAPPTGLEPYDAGRVVAPIVASAAGQRVVRGGSWKHGAFALRTTWRLGLPAGARERNLGFRCAWDAW